MELYFFPKKDRIIGHEVTLVKERCRLDFRKYSFSRRTINEWNKLSTDSVYAREYALRNIDISQKGRLLIDGLLISQWLLYPLAIWLLWIEWQSS